MSQPPFPWVSFLIGAGIILSILALVLIIRIGIERKHYCYFAPEGAGRFRSCRKYQAMGRGNPSLLYDANRLRISFLPGVLALMKRKTLGRLLVYELSGENIVYLTYRRVGVHQGSITVSHHDSRLPNPLKMDIRSGNMDKFAEDLALLGLGGQLTILQ